MGTSVSKFGRYEQLTTVRGTASWLPGGELVRSRIALRVRLGQLVPGDRLPDIGVLAEELGVGEITVRRSLESMCQDGLLDRRRGRAGGTFVNPNWAEVLPLFHDAVRGAALLEQRLLLECGLVCVGLDRIDEADLTVLEEIVELLEDESDPAVLARFEAGFHLDLAGALGGPELREQAADLFGLICLLLPVPAPEDISQHNRRHAALLAALRSNSLERAVAAVREHG